MREGYRVTTADNAADARAKLESLSFDLLVLDVMMPGETGFQLAKSLRENSAVPILMLTAKAETESRITGLELGADDYVPKPFEPRELSLRIANILKRTIPAPTPAIESVRFGDFVFHLGRGELQARRGDRAPHRPRARHAARARRGAGRDRAAHGARRQRRRRERARRRRAGEPPAPQDRARSRQPAVRADRARHRLPAGGRRHDVARRRPCHAALRGRACVGGVGRASRAGSRA